MNKMPSPGLILEAYAPPKAGNKMHFKALVESVTASGRTRLRVPRQFDVSDLKPEMTLMLEYNHEDAHFLMQAKIEAVRPGGPSNKATPEPAFVVLHPPEQMSRIQRRKFFRYPLELKLAFLKVDLPRGFLHEFKTRETALAAWAKIPPDRFINSHTNDIGAGGLNLLSNVELNKGEHLYLEIKVKGLALKVASKVMRVRPSQAGDEYAYHIGVEFIGLNESQQSEIVKFILQEQQSRQKHLFT